MRWALATSAPFLLVVIAARICGLFDWLPATASEALAPATRTTFAESAPALGGLVAIFVAAWLFLRPLAAAGARPGRADVPEAAVALTLLLSLEIILLWLGNSFAALLLIPVLHLCLLTALPEGANRRLLVVGTVSAALLLPVIVLAYYGAALRIGGSVSGYASLLLSSQGSIWALALESLIAGSLASAVIVALARPRAELEAEITVRGPSTYAGPGSLGGTESALRMTRPRRDRSPARRSY